MSSLVDKEEALRRVSQAMAIMKKERKLQTRTLESAFFILVKASPIHHPHYRGITNNSCIIKPDLFSSKKMIRHLLDNYSAVYTRHLS